MIRIVVVGIAALLFCCKRNVEKAKPTIEPISESIYASGIVKSKNQYEAFVTVTGIVNQVFLEDGDSVKRGTPILSISNETQRFNKENAKLAAEFSDLRANSGKLNEAKAQIALSKEKVGNDSLMFLRQKALWLHQIGTKVELEQRELAYENSKTAYYSSIIRYKDLQRQLEFSSSQAKKNLSISSKIESDFILKSEIDGVVYAINKYKGEIVGPQTSLATIGEAKKFVLEMQVDEYDILKVRKGLPVVVALDSYQGAVYNALITKIYPIMNKSNKTFKVEAEFVVPPPILYPNISFEANIVLDSKPSALLIPRSYLWNDSLVTKSNGEKVAVKTGLKDYQKVEITSGLTKEDELVKPGE